MKKIFGSVLIMLLSAVGAMAQNVAPFVAPLTNQTVVAGSPALFTTMVSDASHDTWAWWTSEPPGVTFATPTYQWGATSGGQWTGFPNGQPVPVSTTATAPPGTYLITLKFGDFEFTTTRTATLTVTGTGTPPPPSPPPPPPTVPVLLTMPMDQTLLFRPGVPFPVSTNLRATVNVNAGALSYSWSGNGVSFSSPHGIETLASFGAPGIYPITLLATDGTNIYMGSVTVYVQLAPNAVPLDTVAPTIGTVTPADGAMLSSTATSILFTIAHSDNIGVNWITLEVDGVEVGHATPTRNKLVSPARIYWNESAITKGAHVVRIRAYDSDRNMTIKTINVTRP